MDNDNKKLGTYDDKNSDLDEEVVEIESSFRASSTQRDCNPTTVKLELFDNILIVFDANDLERCKKTVHKVESFSTKHNPSIIKGVKSTSADCNPPVIQGVNSSFAEHNTFVFAKFHIADNANDVKLCGEAMKRANSHFFKSVTAISNM